MSVAATISPLAMEAKACQSGSAISSRTNCTDPSTYTTFTPPGCMLRGAGVGRRTVAPLPGAERIGVRHTVAPAGGRITQIRGRTIGPQAGVGAGPARLVAPGESAGIPVGSGETLDDCQHVAHAVGNLPGPCRAVASKEVDFRGRGSIKIADLKIIEHSKVIVAGPLLRRVGREVEDKQIAQSVAGAEQARDRRRRGGLVYPRPDVVSAARLKIDSVEKRSLFDITVQADVKIDSLARVQPRCRPNNAGRKSLVGCFVVLQCQAELLEVVGALRAPRPSRAA